MQDKREIIIDLSKRIIKKEDLDKALSAIDKMPNVDTLVINLNDASIKRDEIKILTEN